MASLNKFNNTAARVARGIYDFSTDQIAFALTNSAPSAGAITLGDINQIPDSGGYTSAGLDVITSAFDVSDPLVAKLVLTDYKLIASGGAIGPFRYVVIFDRTVTSGGSPYLVGWADYGLSITLAVNESLTLDFNALGAITFE